MSGGAPSALRGRRIVVTGASGQIAGALAQRLARDNEVFGVARFGDEARRAQLEAAGVRAVAVDLVGDDYSALPRGIDVVLHLAASLGPDADTERSMQLNAVSTGRVISHYREVDAILVMSTGGVYRAHPDPWHRYVETDPLGDPASPASPAYGVTKVAQEAVARFCAREFGVRVVIGRMNASFGPGGGMPARHVDRILTGEPIVVRGDPLPFSPIFEDDIADHLGPLLAAASDRGAVVNFGGDEVVTVQEWCALIGELLSRTPRFAVVPLPGSQPGVAFDIARRQSLTGPDPTGWRRGMELTVAARAGAAK
ncbi:MAG: NAD(P)-dependent oxidoreductase [Microbacterium sp.]